MRELKFRCWCRGSNEMIQSASTEWLAYKTDVPLMQYTGLKDKNGKEIYEGDILLSNSNVAGVVGFESGSFVWKNDPLGWDLEGEKAEICLPDRWGQVVGNIYENPELREKENP
jgi:uncharacterized phage protein (TIGR01671 family)